MEKSNIILFGMITFALLSMSIVSAFYSGEEIKISHNLGTDKISWLIVDNTSEITILPEITFNSTDIIIYFPSNMPPNSFTLVFFEEQTNEVIKEVRVGSSGSTKTIYKNNTIYEDKIVYKDKINNETIKEIPVEIENEVSKPYYKTIWFYSSIILFVILMIMLTEPWRKKDN